MSLLCCSYKDTVRPIAEVTVGKFVQVQALFDSGAEATLLNVDYYSCLSPPPRLTPYRTRLTTANGTKIRVIGQANVEYEVARKKFTHPTIIVQGLSSPCIIGADFMEKNGVSIDLARKKIIVHNEVENKY